MMFQAILSFLLAQPVSSYDRAETIADRTQRLEVVAQAIDDVARGNKGLAAFLIVQAIAETNLRRDVQVCQCPAKQCDNGRAHGLWQTHRAPTQPGLWDDICGLDIASQTLAASWIARYYRPKSLECSFAAMGGSRASCGARWAIERANRARKLEGKL